MSVQAAFVLHIVILVVVPITSVLRLLLHKPANQVARYAKALLSGVFVAIIFFRADGKSSVSGCDIFGFAST